MVISANIDARRAQSLIEYLKENDLFDSQYKSKRVDDTLCFAVTQKFKLNGVTFTEVDDSYFEQATVRMTLRDALSQKLSLGELALLKTAFDQVGQIAIVEIDEELRTRETLIGETLLTLNSAIKTVLRKDGPHIGVYRTQPMKCIAGVDTREASFIENGVKMKVDVEQVYFSSRLSNERMRIAQQVNPGEDVLVMFAGASPQALIISKFSNAHLVTSVEINPKGHEYGLINVKLNKLKNVELYCDDVHVFTSSTQKRFDRIVMNLPKTAYEFLDDAVALLKPNGVIHYYDFLHEDEFDLAKKE